MVTTPNNSQPAPAAETAVKPTHSNGSYLGFALDNPQSEAAKDLGLQNHKLNADDIKALKGREQKAAQNAPGFFSRMFDYIAVFFQCLIGMFSGECGFKDFSRLVGDRQSLHKASSLYETLAAPGPAGNQPYANLARPISGVEPDGNGGYKPILKEGKPTGEYKHYLDNYTNPDTAYLNEARDRGMQPSADQQKKVDEIYKQEMLKLYSRQDIKKILANNVPDANKPTADNEALNFVNDKTVSEEIGNIADRMIKEADSLGNFNMQKHRNRLIGDIKAHMMEDHEQNKKNAANIASPTPTQTSDLGNLTSPRHVVTAPVRNPVGPTV